MQQLSYQDQLADSRWLQKKAEILIRDNYTCQVCGAKSYLSVHHKNYQKCKLAWEYPNKELITLCKDCHSREHKKPTPYFGGVYTYNHSDYTNYMVCYGVNYTKQEVYLVGIDNGASWYNPLFECVSFRTFSESYHQEYDFWSKCYKDDNFWQEILIKCLLRIYQSEDKVNNVSGFRYNDKMVYEYAHSKIWDLVNTNEILLSKFNDLANE